MLRHSLFVWSFSFGVKLVTVELAVVKYVCFLKCSACQRTYGRSSAGVSPRSRASSSVITFLAGGGSTSASVTPRHSPPGPSNLQSSDSPRVINHWKQVPSEKRARPLLGACGSAPREGCLEQ